MAVRNQYSPYPGAYEEPYDPPYRDGGPRDRPRQPVGDTLVLSLLFIVAPLCGVIGLFFDAFLWIFIIVTSITLLAIWAVGCFEQKRRTFLSGMLVVFLGFALVRGLSSAPSGKTDMNFPLLGAGGVAADSPVNLQAQSILENGMAAGNGLSTEQLATQAPTPVATAPLGVVTIAPAFAVAPPEVTPPPLAPQAQQGQETTALAMQTETQQSVPTTDAEIALNNYLTMWRDKNFDGMAGYTTSAWQAMLKMPPSTQLRYDYNRWEIQNWTMATQPQSYSSDVVIIMVNANLVKATAERTAATCTYNFSLFNENGSWRVDPDTMRQSQPEPVSLQKNAEAQNASSEPTPEPEPTIKPTTKLWYNPDGGEYYHAEQQCAKINPKYFSKMKSFEYSELSKHESLKPCSGCKAPK